ncbi:MAG: AbrB/MazE/SpoVT family DNA-binding domain-containing protein [Candidatus Staskawiczbacteria bacterium]|nr:AbrB/MazE/SpoVT family DNA-binding domain-containing protein [Candidatus Staskawiczbacteria bacterium]
MRVLKEKNIRKLTNMGAGFSMGLTLPIEIMEKLGWKEHQKVSVELKGRHLIIKDWKK